MEAVALRDLSKTYPNGKQAVRRVSLALEEGEVFGFLGPNGAGKTTTVKLLGGMLTPTEGSCRVLGLDPSGEPEKVHARMGVVTEHAQMYDELTGMENLVFYGAVFGLTLLYTNKGKNVPTNVTAMPSNTVFLRPQRFIKLPTGTPKNRNQINTIEGTKPVIAGDQSNARCT